MSHRSLGWTALIAWAITFGLAGAQLIEWAQDGPWTPLGPYPDQTIVAVHRDEVIVTGEKCADEPVRVRGTVAWQTVTPAGTTIPVFEGVGARVEGCEAFTFANPIPSEVKARDRELRAEFPNVVWRLVGTETPFDDNRTGHTLSWRTEPFELG